MKKLNKANKGKIMKKWIAVFVFLVSVSWTQTSIAQNRDDSNMTYDEIMEKGVQLRSQQGKDKDYPLTSYELAYEYDKNEIDADKKYKNKILGIIGLVISTDTKINRNHFILLLTDDNLPTFKVVFPNTKHYFKILSKVKNIDVVKIKGKCLGLTDRFRNKTIKLGCVSILATDLEIEPHTD